MGKQANTVKDRTCKSCEQVFQLDAKRLKAHAALCLRAKLAGLVLPGKVERPSNLIIRP